MTSTIGLTCDDAPLCRAVARWLDHTRLEPPDGLGLDVRVADAPPPPDVRTPFRQPGVVVRSGPPQGGVRVWWEVAPAFAELAPGATVARVTLSPAAIRELDLCTSSFLMTVLIFLLRRAGWHHVHAATATALGRRETLVELVRWSAWVVLEPELAQPHLDLLGTLARQARAFRVTLGRDLFDHPDRLRELVA